MKSKKINICLSLLAAATILIVGVNNALAYFTTYTTAEGGLPIHLGDRTEITESFDSWRKRVTITSNADSEPVYVRARAFCARYDLVYEDQSGMWTQEAGSWNRKVPEGESDEYWYYTEIVNGGDSTTALDVVIQVPSQWKESNQNPANPDQEKPEDGETFNVIVIYESTPVRYDENGDPYADWTETLDVVTATGTPDKDTEVSGEESGSGESSEGGTEAGGDENVGE